MARALVEIRLTALAIWRGFTRFYNNDDLTFASSIAYYSLLSFFPFFLIAFSIVALVTSSDADRDALLRFVFRYFPRQFDFVTLQLEALKHTTVRLSVAGSVLMVWAAMGVFGAVTSAVNHAWGVEKQPSYFKHKLISFVMLVVAGLLLMLGLLAVSAINVVETRWFAGVVAATPRLMVLQGVAAQTGRHGSLHLGRRARVLFRPEREGAVSRRLGRRRDDGIALARRAGALLQLCARSLAVQVHGSIAAVVVFLRLDLRVGRHPPLRSGDDRRIRAPPAPPSRFAARRGGVAERVTPSTDRASARIALAVTIMFRCHDGVTKIAEVCDTVVTRMRAARLEGRQGGL